MKIRCLIAVLVTAVCMSTAASQAMPFVSDRTQDGVVVPVADGCWLGWHRNANGGCSRDTYGVFGLGVEYNPGPFYRPGPPVCGWRGAYQVCNVFGFCWWMCN